jgi:hypothetical protein
MLYQLQDEIDDDGMPDGDVTGCESWEDEDDQWEDDIADAHDPFDIEYDR